MKKQTIFKICFTIFLFSYLLMKIDYKDIVNTLSTVNIFYYLVALLIVPILYFIRTYKWNVLLRFTNIEISFFRLLRVLIIGVFYGLITPGKIGEFARAYHLDEQKSRVLPTIFVEKISDIIVLVLLSVITSFVFLKEFVSVANLIFIFLLTSIACVILFLKNKVFTRFCSRFNISGNYVEACINNTYSLFDNKILLLSTFFLTLIYYIVAYVFAFFLMMSLEINPLLVVSLPLIILMGNLPITISGMGLRESVAAIIFVLMGESNAKGFAFSFLLFFSMILLPGLIGYLLSLQGVKHAR